MFPDKSSHKKITGVFYKTIYIAAVFALAVFAGIFVFIFTAEPASAAIDGATENSPDGDLR